jgi:uncharacterized protein YjbJ (UPF0337 family)
MSAYATRTRHGVTAPPNQEGFMTSKNVDKAKGRVKEAVGALTDNKRLKNEGRIDHAKGSAKNAADKVADSLTGRNRNKDQQ